MTLTPREQFERGLITEQEYLVGSGQRPTVALRYALDASEQLRRALAEEAPGVKARVFDQSDSQAVAVEFGRAVESFGVHVDRDALLLSPETFAAAVMRALEEQRQRAIRDYGIQRIIDREKRAATDEERGRQRAALLAWIEAQRPTYYVPNPNNPDARYPERDDDGEETDAGIDLIPVRGELPPALERLVADWHLS